MSANRDEAPPAANETAPPSNEPTPFALRAETVRQGARESASEDVQQILERGQAAVHALRQRHALELLAAQSEAKTRRVPRWLLAGIAVLTAMGIGSFALLERTELSDTPASAFTPPESGVEMAIAFSDARAEREVATQPTGKRPHTSGRPRPKHAACDPNSFDPIDSCL
jgi:cytochrome c-type biogenesis protein CcmH/NrfG